MPSGPIKVLGLAIDPVHKNLYWTDEGQSTVEMYSYVSKVFLNNVTVFLLYK